MAKPQGLIVSVFISCGLAWSITNGTASALQLIVSLRFVLSYDKAWGAYSHSGNLQWPVFKPMQSPAFYHWTIPWYRQEKLLYTYMHLPIYVIHALSYLPTNLMLTLVYLPHTHTYLFASHTHLPTYLIHALAYLLASKGLCYRAAERPSLDLADDFRLMHSNGFMPNNDKAKFLCGVFTSSM